jgi:amidohydrolase
MDLRQKIKRLAAAHYDDVVGIRRHIHRFPELSYEEYKTSAYIQEQLRSIGIPFKSGYLKNGIVAIIEGKKATRKAYAQRVVALRAEMDALPIVEKNDIPFKSENHRKMHACGHDMHMAALLGTGMILNELRASVKGTVMLIFQPAEEKLPGGADQMIREGIFADLKPSLVIGQHVLPGMYTGNVGYRPGVYMASSDEIYLNVKGKGGHGGVPHQMIDPVLITAHIIVALQQVVSRNANAATPTVLSFGKIHAPGTTNVVPDEVFVEGTFRTMNETWRREAHERIVKIAGSIASGMGGSCEVTITHGYPVLENNEAYTQRAKEYSRQLLGDDKVLDMDLRMTSDDFAYYSQQFPAVFYRFGTTDAENKFLSPVHTAHYMADEKSLETAMANLAWLTISFLADE